MAASLMQVPPSCPGNVWEPCFSRQFRMWPKLSIVTLLVEFPLKDRDPPALHLSTSSGGQRHRLIRCSGTTKAEDTGRRYAEKNVHSSRGMRPTANLLRMTAVKSFAAVTASPQDDRVGSVRGSARSWV